jgi:hypothetical protein
MKSKAVVLLKRIVTALREAEGSGVKHPIGVLEQTLETREDWDRFRGREIITKSTDRVKQMLPK